MNGYSADNMDIDSTPLVNGGASSTHKDNDWPDAPSDRNEFYRDLQAMHNARATSLDSNPRVHGKPIDLYDLFYNIEGRGGYDKVSAEKLLWRKVAAEFHCNGGHVAASAFQIKTVYYKNLAAYAMKRVHKIEPPPKEILEDLTAKGSDLLTRTVHNFKPPRKSEYGNGTPRDDDGSESDTRGTPGADDVRAPRQAMPQRISSYQQDTYTQRQQRQPPAHMVMPTQPSQTPNGYSIINTALNSNGTSFVASKYETRTFPLSFRPVPTPSAHPAEFLDKTRRIRAVQLAEVGRLPPPKPQFMAPGSMSSARLSEVRLMQAAGFAGPNIYLRVLMALRSGTPEEQHFAMRHLVKISHDKGDKFRFDTFVGFAEGLVEKALEISSLFYHSEWEISYMKGDELSRNNVLDGVDGTSDLLERISALQEKTQDDGLETQEFCNKLQICIEAILVLRNMSMLPDNAKHLAEEQIIVKDLLIILLNLPARDCLVEVKNDALDIAEQLTEFWDLEADDPLYTTLLSYLEQKDDRGAAISALRAICRISLQLEETNELQDIPLDVLNTLIQWSMLGDDDLVGVCLDFFYQYTAVPSNVASMLKATKQNQLDLKGFVEQLVRLLLHNAREVQHPRQISPETTVPTPTEIPQVPQDLLEQMISIAEPERSSVWLRALFEEDKDSEMTQISLWQAYQARFQYFSNTAKPMLVAADFIKRISETLKGASAQVLQTVSPPKFIIRGIRPRKAPVDFKGKPYMPCLWVGSDNKSICGHWALTPEKLYEHILKGHLGFLQDPTGKWDLEKASKHVKESKTGHFDCHWSGCKHFAKDDGTGQPVEIGLHIKTHLPDTSEDSEDRARYNSSKRRKIDRGDVQDAIEAQIAKPRAAKLEYYPFKNTASRDTSNGRQEAQGLPLSAILVMRNLARSIPKAVAGPRRDANIEYWYTQLLKPIMAQLWHVAGNNLALQANIYDLLETIEKENGESLIVNGHEASNGY